MGQLDDYSIDQVAGGIVVMMGSLGALLHVLFSSKCTQITCCWGLWQCQRVVEPGPEPEPDPDPDPDPDPQLLPNQDNNP